MPSDNLQIALIATNQASPEVPANTAIKQLDQALCGMLSKSLSDADYVLTDTPPTASEARYNMVFVFTGALTAYRHITVPQSKKLYVMSNQTSGNQPLIIQTAAPGGNTYALFNTGAGSPFTFSDYVVLYCDGTNVIALSAGVQLVTPPSHSSSLGVPGQLAYDSSHIYICIGANSWARASIGGGW